MKMTMIKLAFTLMISLIALSVQADSGDPVKGKALSATCAACHGPDGNSAVSTYPKLAGQHASYIAKQLQDYKSGAKENAIMSGMAAPLGDQDILDLAAYFSSQKIKPGTANPELVELGESVYRTGVAESGVPACMACHGPSGSGNPAAMYPALAGQYAEYTATQMQLWKSGERANDLNAVMRTVAKSMTQEQIEAVSSYLQGLR
jgi:cytochrome c553